MVCGFQAKLGLPKSKRFVKGCHSLTARQTRGGETRPRDFGSKRESPTPVSSPAGNVTGGLTLINEFRTYDRSIVI